MAKKKKRKSLLPKRIAGVKVPKALRKGRFGQLLASPTGRAVLAEVLLGLGAVAGARKAGADVSVRSFATGVAQRLNDGQPGGQLAVALGDAARAFVAALQPPPPQPGSAASAPPTQWDEADPPRSKKKSSPSTPPII